MIYLFFQTWIWMLVAAAVGLVAGWLIWGRGSVSVEKAVHVDSAIGVIGGSAADYEASDEDADDYSSEDNHFGINNGDSDGKLEDWSEIRREKSHEKGNGENIGEEPATEGVTREIPRDNDTTDADKLIFVSGSGSNDPPDNLKRIRGIGPVLEKVLNQLGIYHLHQIANFSREEIDRVDNHLSFSGRIDREDWVGQAKTLVGDIWTDSNGS
jgi:predicted flap endonuclease-1-like 5' DNA nuclease